MAKAKKIRDIISENISEFSVTLKVISFDCTSLTKLARLELKDYSKKLEDLKVYKDGDNIKIFFKLKKIKESEINEVQNILQAAFSLSDPIIN